MEEYVLLDSTVKQPTAAEMKDVKDVRTYSIEKQDTTESGYCFLHGVILAKYHNRLYACWAYNKGSENTNTEVVRGSYSTDNGKTWEKSSLWIQGAPGVGVSHGTLFVMEDTLWGIFPEFPDIYEKLRPWLYRMEEDGTWTKISMVADEPFWPLSKPVKMDNGNYIMAGAYLDYADVNDWHRKRNVPGAVAICDGKDIGKWRIVQIPKPADMPIWGETGIIVEGNKITAISRCMISDPVALAAVSEDYGEHWTTSARTNMAMTDAKPYAGILSNSKRYLLGTTAAENGYLRHPLTIALGMSGTDCFQEILAVRRHDPEKDLPLDDESRRAFSYPFAIEEDGKLYVAYSVRMDTKKTNQNNAELAVIDIRNL